MQNEPHPLDTDPIYISEGNRESIAPTFSAELTRSNGFHISVYSLFSARRNSTFIPFFFLLPTSSNSIHSISMSDALHLPVLFKEQIHSLTAYAGAYVRTNTSFSISCREFETAKNALHLKQVTEGERNRCKDIAYAIVHRVLEDVQRFRPYVSVPLSCSERRFSPSYMVAFIRIIRFDAIFCPSFASVALSAVFFCSVEVGAC